MDIIKRAIIRYAAEWERLHGLGGGEKDGTEGEGIFVEETTTDIRGTLRGKVLGSF